MVTGSRIARPQFNSNSPVVSVDEAILEQSSSNSFAGPNDCTILDRRRDPGACRSVADTTARGARGRANAQLLDGLALAWQGNLDRAIDAFDRAIRSAPDASIGYLNRGLAYQAKGDLRRALADLNRAVSRNPKDPRGYYHRSLLHRARGDASAADADARRAIELEAAYAAVLR